MSAFIEVINLKTNKKFLLPKELFVVDSFVTQFDMNIDVLALILYFHENLVTTDPMIFTQCISDNQGNIITGTEIMINNGWRPKTKEDMMYPAIKGIVAHEIALMYDIVEEIPVELWDADVLNAESDYEHDSFPYVKVIDILIDRHPEIVKNLSCDVKSKVIL